MGLIDADKLMQDIRNTITEQSNTIDWLNLINRQPIAYDVDAVVKQLDEYITKIVGRKSALYQTVMQIVKGGGVDDNPNSNNDYRPDM